MPLKVAILGTGNVAFHLLKQLQLSSQIDLSIISRSSEKALATTKDLGADIPVFEQGNFQNRAFDLIVIAVPDNQIDQALQTNRFSNSSVVVHTSGPQSMSLLESLENHGVLYPFQTFTKEKDVDFSHIPLLIEGNNLHSRKVISEVAKNLGPKIYELDSHQRLKVHLAAVFASNFSNNLYKIAEGILQETNLTLQDFNHLIKETSEKALEIGPTKAQTGPAIRNDQEILEQHIALLKDEELIQLYKLHSHLIRKP